VGIQACAPCHEERVAEFKRTNHFRTSRLPEVGDVAPGFSPSLGQYFSRDPALHFQMTQAGTDFLETSLYADTTGEKRTSARVDLVYGAGAADEVYFSWRDDKLYELPLVWLYPQKRWGAAPEARYNHGHFNKETTPRCLECHNVWLGHVPGTLNQYDRHSLIPGVTCEKCHGPGGEHVAFHEANPDADVAHAIVHPGSLTRARQIDVCGQCHANAPKRRGPAFSYQPGKPLDDFFRTNRSDRPEEDHVANQVKYMQESKCFQKSSDLTCTSCHNPHRPKPAANSDYYQRACLKCHKQADCHEQPRLPEPVRGNCIGCHMPQHLKINVWFDTEEEEYVPAIARHEHRIGVFPWATQKVLRDWYGTQVDAYSRRVQYPQLTATLRDYWLGEAERFRREYRLLASIGALREAVALDSSETVRKKLQETIAFKSRFDADVTAAMRLIDKQRNDEAITALNKLLVLKPDLAVVHAKLGMLHATAGRDELSFEHLKAVARCDPDDAYGYTMLGWLAYRKDKPGDALLSYQQAAAIEPYSAKINYLQGLALVKLDRLPEAVASFREVVKIDPNHAGGCQALSHALHRQGETAEALRYALRAARLTGFQNADVLVTLAEAYAAAGRRTEFEETSSKALESGSRSSPDALPQLRRRLEVIRETLP
jgi:tetratricopeptide (TPR) repeat protein